MTRDAVQPTAQPATGTTCPACRSKGAAVGLTPGASLEGCSCLRCGGTLLPTTGSERLLHEELALDRAALVDLAESFGGRRFGCPGCRAAMRTLILRGVDVDLCFHCGALWLDQGELERLSGNRHRGLAPTQAQPLASAPTNATNATTALQRPDATVRLDARHPLRLGLGSVTRAVGIVVGLGAVAGLGKVWAVGAVAAIVAGTWLRRRRIVDVFPRARRFLRSRAWMPTDPRDEKAERLDERTFVVVRPVGTRLLATSSFVDSCGRLLAPLDSDAARRTLKKAHRHARRLGAVVVVDPRVDGADVVARPLPDIGGAVPFAIRLKHGPLAYWAFEAVSSSRVALFLLQNAVPARGNEDAVERLALCFCLERADGTRLRLHDDGHGYTVVVDAAGEPLGSIRRRGGAGFDWLSCSLSSSATRVHLLSLPVAIDVPIVDDGGARCGVIRLIDDRLQVDIRADVDAETRFACVMLAAHAALDAGRQLESR